MGATPLYRMLLFFSWPILDLTFVGLLLAVVVDTYEKKVAGVLRHFGGVLFSENLVDGGVGISVVFQLQNDGWRIDIFAGDEN